MTTPMTFDWLLDPVTVDDFEAKIWQRQTTLVAQDRPGHVADLFGFAAFEHVLEFGQPKPPSIRVVCAAAPTPPVVPIASNGRLDVDRLRRAYAEGCTVVINNLQDFWWPVARLVQSIQERTSFPVEANTYLTPPRSRGLKPHYDTHDVLVVQVEGTKRWHLWGEDAACPWPQLRNGDPFERGALPDPDVVDLLPGDVLYIPRGWIHEAETGDGSSLHITLGFHPPMGRDLLLAVVDGLCRVHPEFRTPLPLGYLRDDFDRGELAPVVERLRALLADGDLAQALATLDDDHVRRGRGNGGGSFVATIDALDHLSLAMVLTRRESLHARVVTTESGAGLQFAMSLVEGPISYLPAMEFAAHAHGPFTIGDLPGLDGDRQIDLARTLLRDGLLELAPAP